MAPLPSKRPHRGFQVPKSMPDGVHKRKLEKIKKTLSHNSNVKRSYRKTLRKMGYEVQPPPSSTIAVTAPAAQQSTEEEKNLTGDQAYIKRMQKKPKLSRFKKEEAAAAAARMERENNRLEFEKREAERKQKLELREKQKKSMMAYTKTGQPKLGARINVLLDKLQREGS